MLPKIARHILDLRDPHYRLVNAALKEKITHNGRKMTVGEAAKIKLDNISKLDCDGLKFKVAGKLQKHLRKSGRLEMLDDFTSNSGPEQEAAAKEFRKLLDAAEKHAVRLVGSGGIKLQRVNEPNLLALAPSYIVATRVHELSGKVVEAVMKETIRHGKSSKTIAKLASEGVEWHDLIEPEKEALASSFKTHLRAFGLLRHHRINETRHDSLRKSITHGTRSFGEVKTSAGHLLANAYVRAVNNFQR